MTIAKPRLPNKPRGAPRADDRKVLNSLYCQLRTRSPYIQERYGPSTACYIRHQHSRQLLLESGRMQGVSLPNDRLVCTRRAF